MLPSGETEFGGNETQVKPFVLNELSKSKQ
jgi:hypothetical protein